MCGALKELMSSESTTVTGLSACHGSGDRPVLRSSSSQCLKKRKLYDKELENADAQIFALTEKREALACAFSPSLCGDANVLQFRVSAVCRKSSEATGASLGRVSSRAAMTLLPARLASRSSEGNRGARQSVKRCRRYHEAAREVRGICRGSWFSALPAELASRPGCEASPDLAPRSPVPSSSLQGDQHRQG